eukprot:763996-Hanusia_phi.AAC.10
MNKDDELERLLAEMREEPISQMKSKKGSAKKCTDASSSTSHSKADLWETSISSVAGDGVLWNREFKIHEEIEKLLVESSQLARRSQHADDKRKLVNDVQRLAVEEAIRWREMSKLAGEFRLMGGDKLGAKWTRHFEKWLYSRRAACPTCPAGIFPLGKENEKDEELQRKLEAAGISAKQAMKICETIGKGSRKAASTVGRTLVGKGGKVKVKRVDMQEGERLASTVRHDGKFRFLRNLQFACTGAHYKAGGFQAAIHGSCFDTLMGREFRSQSSIRRRHDFKNGTPLMRMRFVSQHGQIHHMEDIFSKSELPLSFVIIIPYLPDQNGWKRVYDSEYKKAHLKVKQAEHGYFEGSQHDRINRYRIAPFDTSVIFLQNEAGSHKWPATKEKLVKLRSAPSLLPCARGLSMLVSCREAFKPKLELNPHGLNPTAPDHSDQDGESEAEPSDHSDEEEEKGGGKRKVKSNVKQHGNPEKRQKR